MAYERINWQNESSGGTPLSAENLNHMDSGIAEAIQKIDSRLAINVDGTLYPITLISQRTVDGVEGFLITIDLGNSQESTFFVADGVGLNAVKSAIEAQIPSAVVVDSNLNGTSTNPVQNSAIVTALTGKLNSPAGGTAGQVLQKTSEGARWADIGTPSAEQIQTAVNAYIAAHPEVLTPISQATKSALLDIAEHVAYIDANGQSYYNALDAALNAKALLSITAVYTQSGTVYDTDSLDSLKTDLVVTAYYDDGTSADVTSASTLSGTLTVGTSTITVTYQEMTAQFTVNVTLAPNLVLPTTTINGTLYYCGLGTDNDGNDGLYLRNSSQNRRTVAYDSGNVKYRCRQSTSSTANYSACPEIDYYPIPIPAGATTVTVTTPSNMRVAYDILEISTEHSIAEGYYYRSYGSSWDTSSQSHAYDVSAYNDGTYFIAFNIESTATSVSGFAVTIE